MTMQLGAEGMVGLQYLGKQAGTTTWIGPVTKATYRFGRSRPSGYVDQRDVGIRGESGLLNLREGGSWLFALDNSLNSPAAAQEEKPQEAPTGTSTGTPTEEPETVEPEELVEAAVEESAEIVGPTDKQGRALNVTVPDPGGLTVEEVKGLTLTQDQWKRLYQFELKGKKRKSVLAWADDHAQNLA